MFTGFTQIFKDNNDYNEKTIIGFIAFAVMVVIAVTDLVTGVYGVHLEIKEYIFDALTMITLGSFGVAGLEKFSPAAKVEAEAESGVYNAPTTDSCPKECPHCGEAL